MKLGSPQIRSSSLPRPLAFAFLFLSAVLPLSAQKLDMDKLKAMKARSIGPAGMSGRVTAIDAVHRNPEVIIIGTASGGLWKSTSGGIQWEPIFDEQPVASIGAVAIDQNNPDVIWVGTGEGNPRNSQSNGNGVYRSLDGGKNWQHLGLDQSRSIHRLILDPRNGNVAYAGVTGAAWAATPDRGVFKTVDGGKTWQKVLFVDEKTGVADLVMDPTNPNKLIAALWEYRRWPWFFKSGGPGSGLYVTFDGGLTWKKRTDEDGLPKGDLGRIGLAIAPSRPNRVYALIEAKKNGLYHSDDGGFKWTKIADDNIGNRPFYYHEIHVDPQNENRIYNLHSLVTVSEDGGKTFSTLLPFNRVHPDHHAWWIHPHDANFLMDGNDGGLAISRDRGETWRFVENLPLAQFYHINVDMEIPYNIYGGMQDNGSWRGPSAVWRSGGIRNAYWEEVAFGDGFDVVPDPLQPRYGYAMSQGGFLRRYDLVTGEQRLIKPLHPEGLELRFNWNAGLAIDPIGKNDIYYGSQFLHKSVDQGATWEIISPDLTSNDPEKQKQLDSGGLTFDTTAAENFTTIIAVEPSPLQQGVIWVGTDDGNLQLTMDGGATWTNLTRNIKGVPEGTWIPQIRASTYQASEAFVIFDNHRRNDWTPYAFYTADFGKTWQRLADGDRVWGYTLAIAQDPVEPKLLFLGTEFGLYVSIDFGKTWTLWKHGIPTVSTMDLVIHPRDYDLVAGTFGRAAYVLDDIRPLRAIAASGGSVLNEKLALFDVPAAVLVDYAQAAGTRFAAEAMYSGENRPFGALISFLFTPEEKNQPESSENSSAGKGKGKDKRKDTKTGQQEDAAKSAESTEEEPAASSEAAKEPAGEGAEESDTGDGSGKQKTKKNEVKIEILDGSSQVIRTLKTEAKAGLNRVTWNLDQKGRRSLGRPKPAKDAPEPSGRSVKPGVYTVRISHGELSVSKPVNVIFDPRLNYDEAALDARFALIDRVDSGAELVISALDRLSEAEKTIGLIEGRLKDREDETAKSLKKKGGEVKKEIKKLQELINQKEVQGIRRDPSLTGSLLSTASFYLSSSWDPPGQIEELAVAQVETSIGESVSKINAFFDSAWQEYKALAEASELKWFDTYEPIQIPGP